MLIAWRITSTWHWRRAAGFVRPSLLAIAIAGLLLAPELIAMAQRAAEGRMVDVPVLWRSSAPGVDVAAFLLPNPNHPWAPASMVSWIRRQPGENIASIPLVALAILVVAWRRAGHRPDRLWMGMSVVFLSLALGPFIRVAGAQTGIPTPWTFLRYLPVIGEARMPARFSVIVIMAIAVMCAGAIGALMRHYPHRRRTVIALVSGALVFELWSAPRPLYSADVPAVYERIARDARSLRVLDLPFGVRDGLTTTSAFNPATLFYQTAHRKPVVGGYLSRLSDAEKAAHLGHPLLGALATLSEGRDLTDAERDRAVAAGPPLVHGIQLGWVVVDEAHSPPALVTLATEALGLTPLARESGFSVYLPAGR
jgi:hypothetical protein